jgi:hypothetical protein
MALLHGGTEGQAAEDKHGHLRPAQAAAAVYGLLAAPNQAGMLLLTREKLLAYAVQACVLQVIQLLQLLHTLLVTQEEMMVPSGLRSIVHGMFNRHLSPLSCRRQTWSVRHGAGGMCFSLTAATYVAEQCEERRPREVARRSHVQGTSQGQVRLDATLGMAARNGRALHAFGVVAPEQCSEIVGIDYRLAFTQRRTCDQCGPPHAAVRGSPSSTLAIDRVDPSRT